MANAASTGPIEAPIAQVSRRPLLASTNSSRPTKSLVWAMQSEYCG